MQWFKLFAEFASDPKVQSMSEVLQRRLIMLYCLRCQGDLSQLTAREIALGLRISLADMEKTYRIFKDKGFIEADWSLPKWEVRQAPTDPKAADRMRNYRRRRGERNGAVTANGEPHAPPPEEKSEEQNKAQEARAPAVTPPVTGTDPPDPAYEEVVKLALHLTGEPAWAEWVHVQQRDGFAADWIREVLNKLKARGRWSKAYARGILEDFRHHGGPDRPAPTRPGGGQAGRPGAAPPAAPVRSIDLRPAPPGDDGDAVRRAWDQVGGPAGLDEHRAREAAQDCPYCQGTGWVRLVRRRKPGPDQPIAATARPPHSSVHCLCPLGEWLRCRTPPDLVGRMPDLATVLAGRLPWDLEK